MNKRFAVFPMTSILLLTACQTIPGLPAPSMATAGAPSTATSSGLWTSAAPLTRTPTTETMPTETPLPSVTPNFDQLWAINDVVAASTSEITIDVLRAEAGLKMYFQIWKKYSPLYRHSEGIKTYFAIWARLTNKTNYRAFFDLYGCTVKMAGKPYSFGMYPPFIIGDEWSSDMDPGESILGGMVMIFGSRPPTEIESLSFDCPPPMVLHGPDGTERISFSMTFDDAQWVPPPDILLPFYDLPDCCEE